MYDQNQLLDAISRTTGIPKEQLAKLMTWTSTLVSHFPTAEVVKAEGNVFEFKIRVDDVFRMYYNEIKKQVPDAKVSLTPCELSEYELCMRVIHKSIITGWNFKPTEIVDNDDNHIYYIPLEQMLEDFDNRWREANKGKPIKLKFKTLKATPLPWHYITVESAPQRV